MNTVNENKNFIQDEIITSTLEGTKNTSKEKAMAIIESAMELKGLKFEEIAVLLNSSDAVVMEKLFETARHVKELIYGDRLVLFAPLYISNLCGNECLYCAFRATNKEVKRRSLTQQEIKREVEMLLEQGQKRLLMVAGESYPRRGFQYILDSIETVYGVQTPKGNIRRLNVNIAPLEVDEFKKLKEYEIGTYQLFQETYHLPTYMEVHKAGKKRDYLYRLTAIDRAFEGGIDDVGIGILFGLYDYRYEVLALIQHIRHLEGKYDVGPHTISVPRLEPAEGSPLSANPPHVVSDPDFKKIIAILRLAVPYTGIILSTRENPDMRRDSFSLGVSQISAGSRTNPGGYSTDDEESGYTPQFSLGDHRSLDEVIRDVVNMGYIPSFCTACYRLGRTGQDFMDLAKPGLIKYHCSPNALSTFTEYLMDFASPETREAGERLIQEKLQSSQDQRWKEIAVKLINEVKEGRRDCFV